MAAMAEGISGRPVIAMWATALVAACAGPPAREPPPVTPDAEVAPDLAPASGCQPGPGASGAPATVAELVALVNSLPRPLELPCFLESLARPLDVHANVSTISLQPAVGERSPRVFLFSGRLIMSVVPEGMGQALLEVGQLVTEDRSLKAELAFPITLPLAPADPFEHVRRGEGTTCRFCHPAEERAADIPDAPAYVSGAFSPALRSQVSLERLREERARCDATRELHRCAVLGALFDHGEVRWREFPAGVPTAFGPR
jgi:hypothetical protein